MAIILFDDNTYRQLLPLVFTRPVADLRIGILTIAEKWGKHLKQDHSFRTRDYLSNKYPVKIAADNLFINGAVCPDEHLLEAIDKLGAGDALKYNDRLIAVRLNEGDALAFDPAAHYREPGWLEYPPVIIHYPEYIFRYHDT